MTPDEFRAFVVGRSLFRPTTLQGALDRMGYVQADPIRAPARAQDLILRHRVTGYKAGDLERKYPRLRVEEDFFVNYGFLTRELQAALHPRPRTGAFHIERDHPGLAERVLEFVQKNGPTHPRDIEDSPSVSNWWGGTSQATTQALDALHYWGKLRVARRDKGIRVYDLADHLANCEPVEDAMERYVDCITGLYAPMPYSTFSRLVSRHGAPTLHAELRDVIKKKLKTMHFLDFSGQRYYWPEDEVPTLSSENRVRFLAPFDPVVWDRDRFEALWGWAYRFEAYTPVAKRTMGHYALPLLWRNEVIGYGNLKVIGGSLDVDLGFVKRRPTSKVFQSALDREINRMKVFLGL